MATSGFIPSTDRVRCVHNVFVTHVNGVFVWDDKGSGADDDVTVWSINSGGNHPIHAVSSHSGIPPTLKYIIGKWVNSEADQYLKTKYKESELNDLLQAYNPVWHFHGDQDSKFMPIDIDSSFNMYSDLQKLDCFSDNGAHRWRLNYNDGVARNYWSKTDNNNVVSTYGFAQVVEGGIDLHYSLYYPYNVASPLLENWDHEGDWEGAIIRLRSAYSGKNYYLRPQTLTTNAHGCGLGQWRGLAKSYSEFTNSTDNPSTRYHNDNGEEISPPALFVAGDSHGVYPNNSHERDIFSFPGANSTNRTCVDGHPSPLCDFIETADIDHRKRFNLHPIWVKLTGELVSLYSLRNSAPVKWLGCDVECGAGAVHHDMTNLPEGIWRWGDSGNSGGPEGIQYRSEWQSTKVLN